MRPKVLPPIGSPAGRLVARPTRRTVLLLSAGVLLAGSCTYNFDDAFSPTPKIGNTDASDDGSWGHDGPGTGGKADSGDSSTGKGGTDGGGAGGIAGSSGLGGAAGVEAGNDGPLGGAAGGGGIAGSGGTAAGGGAGTAGKGGGGTGGGPTESNCTNHVDDDGDGTTDCEDSDCLGAGYRCAVGQGAPWSSPGYLRQRDTTQTATACGNGYKKRETYNAQLLPNALQCSCACDPPTGTVCHPTFSVYSDKICTQGERPITSSCVDCTDPDSGTASLCGSLRWEYTVTSGTCQARADRVGNGATWGLAADFCVPAVTGGGCGSTGQCLPPPPPGYASNPCVHTSSESTCTSSTYPSALVVFDGYADTRDCKSTSCGCGGASGEFCQAKLLEFGEDSCPSAASPDSYGWSTGCSSTVPKSPQLRSLSISISGSGGGICDPTGTAEPTGSGTVFEVDPATFCCE